MVVGDLRMLDEDDGRGRRRKRRRRRRWKSILIVYSEKQAVVSTVMCTRVETKRKENCTGLWVRSRIYSTGIIYSHSVSVHAVQMQWGYSMFETCLKNESASVEVVPRTIFLPRSLTAALIILLHPSFHSSDVKVAYCYKFSNCKIEYRYRAYRY